MNKKAEETLLTYREEINKIDQQLIRLFENRMELSNKVATYKAENNLPLYHPAREEEILDQVTNLLPDGLGTYGRTWFSTLMDVSKSYQGEKLYPLSKEMKKIEETMKDSPSFFPRQGTVVCVGPEGSYSQQACQRLFTTPKVSYVSNFHQVFEKLENDQCEFAILPLENSAYGSVGPVYDLLKKYNYSIVKSLRLHVNHHLLVKPGTTIDQIKEIYSHEQAFGQCRDFLSAHGQISAITTSNTALAAKKVAEGEAAHIAAIGSREAASIYGLEILEENIQTTTNNYTRFICVTKKPTIYPGADKITIILSLPHTKGSLYHILSKFVSLGINLTKLESRPIVGSDFQFLFYLDLQACIFDPPVFSLLNQLSHEGGTFQFLGNYSEVN